MTSEGLTMTCSNHIDPYKRVCSVTTLQSDKRGYFSSIVEKLRESPSYEASILKIEQTNDQTKLMKIISSLENLSFTPRPIYKGKNENEAINLRLKGNEEFKKKEFKKALQLYSGSVMIADHFSEQEKPTTLAFSYGNRSACLLKLGNYEEACTDINLALAFGYPEEGRYKLYERLGRIYNQMGLSQRARTSFTIAKQMASSTPNLNDEKRTEFIEVVELLLKECHDHQSTTDKSGENVCDLTPDLDQSTFCSKITDAIHPEFGRHILANERIPVSETVLVENPYAAVLYPEKSGLYCAQCFKKLIAAIPCPKCSGVAFCSVLCRDKALNSYHQFECQFKDILNGLGCSQVVRLAFRMITQQSFSTLLKNKDLIMTIQDESNIRELPDDPFLTCLALVGLTSERWPGKKEDNLLRGVMSFILISILRAAGYFGKGKETTHGASLSNNELFVSIVILRCIQILQFNAHEVYQVLRANPTSLKPCKNVSIGLAIYTSASLFNHSCHGNVTRFFIGKRLHVKTLHPINPGQEVCENYGPTFYLKEKSFRQRELAGRYFFHCSCKACKENWPLLNKLEETNNATALRLVDEAMTSGDVEASIRILSEVLSKHKKDLKPSQDTIRAEDKLRICISNLGSFFVVEK